MALVTRYVNTASTAGGDGTTNGEAGATRAYASLSEWEADEQTDLVTDTDSHVVLCGVGSGSAADTTACLVDGWTTSATYDLTIKANPSDTGGDQRAQMPWATDIYRLEITSAAAISYALRISVPYVEIRNLQVRHIMTGNEWGHGILWQRGADDSTYVVGCLAYGCHVRSDYSNASDQSSTGRIIGMYPNIFGSTYSEVDVVNCAIHTQNLGAGTAYNAQAFVDTSTRTTVGYNITSIQEAQTQNFSYAIGQNTASFRVFKNCLARNDDTTGASFYYGFSNADETGNDYCASNIADITAGRLIGSNSRESQTFTFVSSTDFHLATNDAGAKDYGVNLSGDATYPFSDDFEGASRTVPWDIGAFNEGAGIVNSTVGLGGGMAGYGDRGGLSGSGGGIVG